ncbi:MAG TPA: hypothetical protein VIG33_07120 [Pseudobdellovibrionaceae bacterium]|jgi:hypothetical protein
MKWKVFLVLSLFFSYGEIAVAETYGRTSAIYDYLPIARPSGLFACSNKIRAGLKNNRILNIAVVLGYSDLTDEHVDLVTDAFTLALLDRKLTSPCTYEHQGFCEFKLIEGKEHQVNHYARNLVINESEDIAVNIFTINSSYSISNTDNKTKYKTLQGNQTQTARNFYSWAQQNADMVFYEGHSRDGGGPDFSPPRPSYSGAVNYPWYRTNKPGLKFLLSALNTAPEKPITLGLFSCASHVHFLKPLRQALPNAKLILSTKVVESGKTKLALLRTLESILNFECDSDLKARLRETSFVLN